jgi:hypothetical protein
MRAQASERAEMRECACTLQFCVLQLIHPAPGTSRADTRRGWSAHLDADGWHPRCRREWRKSHDPEALMPKLSPEHTPGVAMPDGGWRVTLLRGDGARQSEDLCLALRAQGLHAELSGYDSVDVYDFPQPGARRAVPLE